MPRELTYYLFDLLGFGRSVIQHVNGLIPISMEKFPKIR